MVITGYVADRSEPPGKGASHGHLSHTDFPPHTNILPLTSAGLPVREHPLPRDRRRTGLTWGPGGRSPAG